MSPAAGAFTALATAGVLFVLLGWAVFGSLRNSLAFVAPAFILTAGIVGLIGAIFGVWI